MKLENIDLHNHTRGSDGKQLPLRLMLRASEEDRGIISMTDHNSVKGYRLLEKQIESILEKAENAKYNSSEKMLKLYEKVLKLFDEVTILKGTEVITSYNGVIIEVLGYNIDIDIMEKELQQLSEGTKPTGTVLREGFYKCIDENNIVFDKEVLSPERSGSLVERFMNETKNHKENDSLTKDFNNLKEFIVKNLYNPQSPFFVDMSETRPSLESVIQSIHKARWNCNVSAPRKI